MNNYIFQAAYDMLISASEKYIQLIKSGKNAALIQSAREKLPAIFDRVSSLFTRF
jgi:hypothetical protein